RGEQSGIDAIKVTLFYLGRVCLPVQQRSQCQIICVRSTSRIFDQVPHERYRGDALLDARKELLLPDIYEYVLHAVWLGNLDLCVCSGRHESSDIAKPAANRSKEVKIVCQYQHLELLVSCYIHQILDDRVFISVVKRVRDVVYDEESFLVP